MILGIGTDLISVERIAAALGRHGTRLAQRLLAEGELSHFRGLRQPAPFLAKRFAVKEAAAKALRSGIGGGLRWCEFELLHDDRGAPLLRLHGMAAERARALGVRSCHVSLADERGRALAFVIFCNDDPQHPFIRDPFAGG